MIMIMIMMMIIFHNDKLYQTMNIINVNGIFLKMMKRITKYRQLRNKEIDKGITQHMVLFKMMIIHDNVVEQSGNVWGECEINTFILNNISFIFFFCFKL